jgi:hypothetical protein
MSTTGADDSTTHVATRRGIAMFSTMQWRYSDLYTAVLPYGCYTEYADYEFELCGYSDAADERKLQRSAMSDILVLESVEFMFSCVRFIRHSDSHGLMLLQYG